MNTKQKILHALDCALDDISEARLIDILLDAYKEKRRRITDLESANAKERETLFAERERVADEYRRMKSDPLYCPFGEYFFELPGKERRFFCVRVQGHSISAYERRDNIDFAMRQMSRSEWK